MTLEQRVEKLERQNRWLRWGGTVVAAVLVVALLVLTQEKAPSPTLGSRYEDELRSEKQFVGESFVLQDQEGRTRAALEVTRQGGARLVIMDASGVERFSAGLSDYGVARIALGDEDGANWMNLSAHAKGGATLILDNPRVETQLHLGVSEDGWTRLSFGREGKATIDLSDRKGSPSITLVRPSGKAAVSMIVLKDWGPLMKARDANGKVVWRAP